MWRAKTALRLLKFCCEYSREIAAGLELSKPKDWEEDPELDIEEIYNITRIILAKFGLTISKALSQCNVSADKAAPVDHIFGAQNFNATVTFD